MAALVTGCNATGNDAATAASRIKSGVEGQAGAGQALASQVAGTATAISGATGTVTQPLANAATRVGGALGSNQQVAVAQIEQAARAEAARALGVAADQVTIEQVEPVEWSDASLGCAQPGQSYAQVITPGFRIKASAAGKSTEIHADTTGRVIVCENPTQ